MVRFITRDPGYSLALGSALAYTCYDVAVRALLIKNLTVWGMLTVRGALGVALVLALSVILKRPLWGTRRGLLAVTGLFVFCSSVCNTISVSTIPLYQALVLIYLYPVFTLLLAAPINGEPVTGRDLVLAGLALGGCLILIWPDKTVGLELSRGHLIGIAGAFLYSLGQTCIRRLGDGNTGLEPILYYSLYAVILSLPLSALFGSHLGLDNAKGVLIGLMLAFIGIAAQMSGYAALRWLPGFKVGLIAYLEVFLGALISWLIFKDPLSLRAASGGLIIVMVVIQLRRPASVANVRAGSGRPAKSNESDSPQAKQEAAASLITFQGDETDGKI